MKIFSDLGAAVERRWREHDYSEAVFPRVAAQTLRRFDWSRSVDSEAVVRWLIEAPEVPAQHLDSSFGQPPVMVFRGSRFFIEILFWVDSHTAIHQHGFSGAFLLLSGSSLHARYRFALRSAVNSYIRVGTLRLTKVELLRPGAIRQILAGDALIHSTMHLDRPTLTLVVRTLDESTPTPQYSYLPPHIAIAHRAVDARLDRQLKLLELLRRCDAPSFATHATSFLRHTDYYAATLLFSQHHEDLREHSPETLERLLRVARRRHGELIDAWPEVFAEEARRDEIASLRPSARAPEHRFFLAALMTLPDRASIFELVARRHPRRSPKALVLRWVKELTAGDAGAAGNTLPIRLGPASLTVFEWLLDGLSWAQIVARLRRACAPAQLEHQQRNVRRLVELLKQSWLRTLLK